MMKVILLFCSILVFSLPGVNRDVSAQPVHLDELVDDYIVKRHKTVDGAGLDLYKFEPTGHEQSDKRTALVFIHGGGFVSGHPRYFFPHCRYFASRGAVAFSISYRLITKKGVEGIDGIRTCITDCKSAVRHIRKNAALYGIDPDKIVVIGDSAGGHLAAALGMIDDFDAGDEDRTISSMADAMVLYNPAVDLEIEAFNRVFNIPKFGEREMALIKKYSPLSYVRSGLPPLLVMHGSEDTNIPIEQVYRFDSAMKKAGSRCEFIAMEGVKHAFIIVGIGTEETIVRALFETDRFLTSQGFFAGTPTIEMDNGR